MHIQNCLTSGCAFNFNSFLFIINSDVFIRLTLILKICIILINEYIYFIKFLKF